MQVRSVSQGSQVPKVTQLSGGTAARMLPPLKQDGAFPQSASCGAVVFLPRNSLRMCLLASLLLRSNTSQTLAEKAWLTAHSPLCPNLSPHGFCKRIPWPRTSQSRPIVTSAPSPSPTTAPAHSPRGPPGSIPASSLPPPG